MRDASVSNIADGGRLNSVDVIELLEEPESTIEVEEQRFDSWAELMAHVKQILGELE